jgi:hypothetical protein
LTSCKRNFLKGVQNFSTSFIKKQLLCCVWIDRSMDSPVLEECTMNLFVLNQSMPVLIEHMGMS